jgi:hypothetical protein
MDKPTPNYTKEAFLNPFNLGFLIMAMLVAFFLSDSGAIFDIVLLMTAALELIYLGVVPRNDRFQRLINSRQAAEHAKPPSQKEIYQLLSRQSQRRYVRLRNLEKSIRANYRKLSYASQGMLDSHLAKIDGLLNSYLNMLYQEERYEISGRATTEREVLEAIQELRVEMQDDPPRVKAIKARRLRILEQRLQRFKRGAENREIIEAQLETIEDVVKYVHEQSMTLSNPEEITFQLDTLLSEVEETEATIVTLDEAFSNAGPDLLSDMDGFDLPGIAQDDDPARTRRRTGS